MYRSNHRKRGTSAASLVPKFTFCAHSSDLYMGGRGQTSQGRRSFLSGHPHLPHAHIHVLTLSSGTQDRLCGPAHRVLFSSALCLDKRASKQGSRIQECRDSVCVCFSFFDFQGAKHLLIHTIEQPEYCHFKLHNSEKGGFPIIFTYIHTYPNNLNLFEDGIQCIVLFYMHEFCCILLSNITPSSSVQLLYNGGTI